MDKYSTYDDDNNSQVGIFYVIALDMAGRERLTDNIASSLVNASEPVQARPIENFTKCDPHYGRRVEEKIQEMTVQMESDKPDPLPAPSDLNPPRKPFTPAPPCAEMAPRL